jgi:hypothetical protein
MRAAHPVRPTYAATGKFAALKAAWMLEKHRDHAAAVGST